jgi:hypothetical protein
VVPAAAEVHAHGVHISWHHRRVATVRRELRIHHPAEQVWSVVGDPGSIHLWFPGIVACDVAHDEHGTFRTVELGTGLRLVERIVTNDAVMRRFQYRIEGGVFREHLGTVDVIDLGDGTCLTVCGTDAEPAVMALVIGGATGPALEGIAKLVASRAPSYAAPQEAR